MINQITKMIMKSVLLLNAQNVINYNLKNKFSYVNLTVVSKFVNFVELRSAKEN